METSLEAHQRRLLAELSAESSLSDNAEIFPLRLSRTRSSVGVAPQVVSQGDVETSLNAWLATVGERPAIITGDPGSGKTTLLETFALERLNAGDAVFFLRMGLWLRGRPLTEQLGGRGLSTAATEHIFVSRSCWVIFDALDEARGNVLDAAFEEVVTLRREFPSCKILTSCRAAQVPAWIATEFVSARLLPLRTSEVEKALFYLIDENALKKAGEVFKAELVELCTNPLMLSMTQELLLAGHGAVLQITSAAQLYDTFIDLLEERESGKRPPEGALERRMTAGFSLKIVGYIGWRMLEDGAASIRLNKVGDLLSEFLTEERWASWWGDSPKPSVGELLRFLSRRAPLKEMSAASLAPSQLGFMHLTYRDAFAGRHLDLVRNEEDGYSALAERVLDPAQTYWPAVVFLAGREVNAGVTPRQVVDLAFESKRQELLLLAARCVGGRWDTPGGDVGDLLISILDAFKNWDKAFDYDLMRLSRRLVSRLNPDFPQRLRDDLNYFIDKYASVVPREIMNATPEALLALLEGAEEEVTVNALYSLARRRYTSTTLRDTIASKVGDRVNDWRGTVLDQAVAALTDIGSQTSLPLLRSIVTSDSYPVRSRAFAANGVAQLGSLEDLPTLVGLLRDHEFKYRDSASWSLQMLAKRLAVKEPDSLTRISHDYMEALQTETDDTSGKYAKGNILYSLGVLNAHWFGTQIQQFVMHEIEPYVIEDGLLCLGLLAWESSKPLLESFIGHPDPAVRLKACEALLRCGQTDWSCIAELLEDKYRIVRRLVESILHSSPTDQFDDRAGAEMLAMVLKRGAIRTDALKQTFRISSAERPLLELITSQHPVSDLLVYMPTLVGSGENQELRLAVEDVTRLRSYFRLDG